MERIDGFLSGKVQAEWPGALVVEAEPGAWELRRPGEPPVSLGAAFKDARMAVYALIRAHRSTKAGA